LKALAERKLTANFLFRPSDCPASAKLNIIATPESSLKAAPRDYAVSGTGIGKPAAQYSEMQPRYSNPANIKTADRFFDTIPVAGFSARGGNEDFIQVVTVETP
jgi:hypothetical protein